MKRTHFLPLTIAVSGIVAFVLRLSLYILATDNKGLLLSGHPLEIALWILSAAVAALVVLQVLKQNSTDSYSVNFPAKIGPALGCFVFAAGILMTALSNGLAFSLLERLRNIACFLAVPCLIAVAVCRLFGKRPLFGFHAIVCLALTLHTITHYAHWSSSPQLQDAFFPMMGCLLLMLFSYYQTAFDVDMGNRRMQLATGLLAVFCCFAAMPLSHTTLLYLTGGIWTLTNLCTLNPTVDKEEENQ